MLAHWATSFCFSFASPYMIANIKGNTFLVFMGFDILATIFCFFFVKETRGKNLEIAAGTEWEVTKRLADQMLESEKGQLEISNTSVSHGSNNQVSVNNKSGEVVDVQETFKSNIVKG
jgi:hypothetical protein